DAQETELLAGLDAFRDDAQAELMADGDDRPRDRRGVRVGGSVPYERAIHLDGVDGKSPQVRQRRVSRAEVVDGDPDAQLLEPAQRLVRGVLEGDRLGDLQFERRPCDAGIVEGPADLLHDVTRVQLVRGEIDRHAGPAGAGGQGPQISTGGSEHPRSDLVDGPRRLRRRYEVPRWDEAALRVAPADQGLVALDPAVGEADHGLVVQLELPGRHRLAQAPVHLQPIAHASAQRRSIEL